MASIRSYRTPSGATRFVARVRLKGLAEISQSFDTRKEASAFGDFPARSFSRIQVVSFRDKLLSQGLSPGRVNRYLSAMRRCWYWAIDNGFAMPTSPWPRKVAMEEPKPADVLATPEEVAKVFEECDKVSVELGLLARFLVGTGARLSDAHAVNWRDMARVTDRAKIL